ncbi:MAG TPA: glucoamylase family protein, partial [Methanothrix soehngenii]|nr:glucoamylase family protein [Methanothrix soehngenii]
PRIYDIAKELIARTDGRVDAESLKRFVDAYQTKSVLNLGELWAVAIMLRLALIENLRNISLRIIQDRIDRDLANRWAVQIIKTAEIEPKGLIIAVADLAQSDPPLSSAFVTEFARRLEGQGQAMTLPLFWIEERLSETGKSIGHLVQEDIKQAPADKVSIANSIASFRFLDSMDWKRFVEGTSVVEKALRSDPAGTYDKMDFATRDRYRHAVESIAKRSLLTEEDVANKAANLARESATARGIDDRSAHVGFYLIDKGLPYLEREADLSLSLIESFNSTMLRFPLLFYIGAIALITALIMITVLTHAHTLGSLGWLQILAFILLVICISSPVVGLVNWLATMVVRPHALPRMDFSSAIPDEMRTLVVVPSVLSSPEKIDDLLEGLEIRYLANRDHNLHFGLLTDLVDAKQEIMPEDEHLLQRARQGIEALNERYHESIFFLFPRLRRWDSDEEIWRGYERKRGILEELNFLLRGGSENSFSVITGDVSILPGVKYVITVDEDTMMPFESARILVETMAHPLNHPRFDKDKRYVVEGYSILHPRLSSGMNEAEKSRFVKLFGGEPGIDPYTREVSDVYQDIFGEGSFTGKGIYDVDAFSQSLGGRFPENLILSHDLLEGSYARAALVSDVQFYEDYPYHYASDVSRRHRWIRGDWQIASWLLTRVPGPGGMVMDNPISGLSRWKIFDNLRRSLVAPAQISLLLLAWVALQHPIFWTSMVVGAVLALPVLASIRTILSKSEGLFLYKHLHYAGRAIARYLAQATLSLIFLPFEAYFSLDAVVRTGGRMLFTHKRLLEWNTSGSAQNRSQSNLSGFYRSMWIAPAVAISLISYLAFWRPGLLSTSWPLLASWILAPVVAWWISLPLDTPRAELSPDQTLFLRKLSRRTWRFFETFVTPKSHWLPPDNYQENPRSVVANGTSPTNMGLSLLANLTAYDFGYISAGRLIRRNASALNTMKNLERFQGHFYNWYDIKKLKPMMPRYISTVDSGNLAGHLLTLEQGQLELIDQKILSDRAFCGLEDTLQILKDAATRGGESAEDKKGIAPFQVLEQIDRFKSEIHSPPENLSAAWQLLDRQAKATASMISLIEREENSDLLWWARAYKRQLRDHKSDLIYLAPWLMLPIWILEHPIPGEIPEHESNELAGKRSELEAELLGHNYIPSLGEVPEVSEKVAGVIDQISRCFVEDCQEERDWLEELRSKTTDARRRADERIASIEWLAQTCGELAEIKYDFLFNNSRRLLSIGYNIENLELDESCYDLLASEARLCSYVAIAQGQLRQEHWFALGRMLTIAGGDFALLSWGGTMFEYLMPLLIMPTYGNTLLDQTCISIVKRQIEYGQQRKVPWGISESGYSVVDVNQIYQYRAFGVPGLGLKRGLANDLVVAPYASAMALMVLPQESCVNLKRLADEGYLG